MYSILWTAFWVNSGPSCCCSTENTECKKLSRISHTLWHLIIYGNNSNVRFIVDPKHECNIFFIVVDEAEQSSNNWVNGTTVIEMVDSEGASCPSKPRGIDNVDTIVPTWIEIIHVLLRFIT